MSSRPPKPTVHIACNRCRSQKLRCLRIESHPTFSCIRCVRCNAECLTRPSKRSGRPKKSASTAPRLLADPSEVMPPTAVEGCWYDFDLLAVDTRELSSSSSSSGWPPVDADEAYLHETSMFGGGSEACTIMYSSPDEVASPPGRGGSMDSSAPCNPVPEPSPERAHSLVDYESRVFALQRDLSSLLAMLESAPWVMAEDLRLTCAHDSRHGLSDVCQIGFRSNPLAVITQKSGEFAQLLRSFQYPAASHHRSPAASPDSPPSANPRRAVPDLLGILACHLLVVSIYDCVIHHFLTQHHADTLASSPQLRLGGIAIPFEPNLLGNSLFRVVEGQLRPIEVLLGLPDEFCVAGNSGSCGEEMGCGVFSSPGNEALFMALMQVEAETGAMGVIESLKNNMRVQTFN
ncbi:uncharacterized protein L3040_004246 [Drepanopeziza brunnea f. sp. 'multigermtubi']|uniref:uncharacterized protein n=1 Tax=Drepanopeziza brunnea f. sp. 'multigermtubi' TaxID=698441 RepID=UPI002383DDB0|nr:hypothetical protein L3040_004246 [Drepanopeziza brunnea f. sp. 'multigermtubi']